MNRLKSLFLFLFVLSICTTCFNTKNTLPSSSDSSAYGGFLLKYRSYQFGKLSYQSKTDPLFEYQQLSERIKKEIKFQFDQKNIALQNGLSDAIIYYYFVGNDLMQPILPYQQPILDSENFSIRVDTLLPNQHVLVLDLVDYGTQSLIWRAYSKIATKPSEKLFQEIPLSIQSMLNRYPG